MRSPPPNATLALALLLALAAPARAQLPASDSLVLRLAAMSAVTGLEDAMADTLLQLLPGSTRDRAGNVVWTRGSGEPVRVAICPMDEVGWVVGGVTREGYLTLRRVGATPMGPLYDQFLEGQRVTVFGRRGAVPGVVGVRSTHLTRGRPAGSDEPFNLDNAYVDVGAASAAEAAALGIEVLAPVTRAKLPHRYGPTGELVAAPNAAARAACAALLGAALAAGAPASGTSVVAFARRRHFANDGASFVIADRAAQPAKVVLLGEADPWRLPVRYANTPVETVSLADARALRDRLLVFLTAGAP